MMPIILCKFCIFAQIAITSTVSDEFPLLFAWKLSTSNVLSIEHVISAL